MRPYGAWVVIAPFNFPLALAGGPTAAALMTGNTVVVKSSTDTPWSGRLLADCIRDAGLPAGVFNYLAGARAVKWRERLSSHAATAGITFTGSVAVGTKLLQQMASGRWPRPCIAEMGGKNPCIVTARADLDEAAAGIVRSAYGMGGQKCSALSRLYVDRLGRRRTDRPPASADRRNPHRRSLVARELARSRDQCQCRGESRAVRAVN